jgi:hypothetical protein
MAHHDAMGVTSGDKRVKASQHGHKCAQPWRTCTICTTRNFHSAGVSGCEKSRSPTRLHVEVRRIIDEHEMKARIAAMGFEAFSSSPEELVEFVKAQLVKWTDMIKNAGIEPE